MNKFKLFYFGAPVIIAIFVAIIWGSPLDGYGKTTIFQKIFINYFILTALFSSPIVFVAYLILSLFPVSLTHHNDSDVAIYYFFIGSFNILLGYAQWFYFIPRLFQLTINYINTGAKIYRTLQAILISLVLIVTIVIIYIVKF